MASYNDYYDSRPRQSRRHDSFTRPKESAYLEPTVGRRSERYERDNRYSYPPPLPSDRRRHSPTRDHRSPVRKRRSWPPAPTVESERSSLAREVRPRGVLKKSSEDDIPSRGTVDQDPLIQEVPEYMNLHERRFVVFSDSEKEGKSSRGNPTPPTSEDERRRRRRASRPHKLGLDMDAVAPEFEKRTSSPYAFSKPTSKRETSYSAETFLSPDTLTPPQSDSKDKRNPRYAPRSQPSSPRRESARLSPRARKGRDYFTSASENAIEDDSDGSVSSARGKRRTMPAPSRKVEDRPSQSPRTSIVDFGEVSLSGPPPRRSNLDARRQTDTAASLPSPRVFEKSSRPSPLVAAGALGGITTATLASPKSPRSSLTPPSQARESGRGSRNVSPATSTTSRASASPPPSRSPRAAEFHRETSGSSYSSHTSSAAGSRPATPPSAGVTARMPTLPPMPPSDLDWNNMMAANAARAKTTASKVPSRLSTSMRMDSMPEIPRHAATFPRTSNALPYPLDDGPATPSVYMPSEQGYQYFASRPSTLEPPISLPKESATLSRTASPAPGNTLHPSARPELPARHSFANVSPVESRQSLPFMRTQRPETQRKVPVNTVPPTKQEVEAMLAKGMPGCPRPELVAGKDDWYTLVGASSIDFCPDCIEDVWERTIYRNCFRRSVPRDLSTKIQCAFSTPWIRLAWLLTLQQRKPDLVLMRDLADIDETSEPCPGSQEAVRSWYGLRDPDGLFVRDFQICYSDVRKIERLLPTLSGLFVRLPHRASYDKKKCALRTDGNRFSLYLDKILDMHDKATASRKLPDPMPFIDLVERKLRIRECERDNMLLGGLWHFMPSLPEFTVCEDCYEEIVEPEVMKNNDVAMRFNRTMQPVYSEGVGTSCQLYSRRMRKVWKTAVKEGDVKYLARKAKERREAELRLQERYRDVIRRARKLDSRGSGSGSDDEGRRLERDLERISREWKDQWE